MSEHPAGFDPRESLRKGVYILPNLFTTGCLISGFYSIVKTMNGDYRVAAWFILVASMLGNRDWITLKHNVFPQYRDALTELVEPGIALADLTSIWTEFLQRKKDWDQTGNGVNHPNDFGHRVYAQVILTLLQPPAQSREETR